MRFNIRWFQPNPFVPTLGTFRRLTREWISTRQIKRRVVEFPRCRDKISSPFRKISRNISIFRAKLVNLAPLVQCRAKPAGNWWQENREIHENALSQPTTRPRVAERLVYPADMTNDMTRDSPRGHFNAIIFTRWGTVMLD